MLAPAVFVVEPLEDLEPVDVVAASSPAQDAVADGTEGSEASEASEAEGDEEAPLRVRSGEQLLCTNCGTPHASTAAFCVFCGEPFSVATFPAGPTGPGPAGPVRPGALSQDVMGEQDRAAELSPFGEEPAEHSAGQR
jgi:hypothetical protein